MSDASYTYIMNKYHDASKPFDSLKRFTRNDSLFEPETGLDPEMMTSGILENDMQYAHLPHSLRKARALEFVLDHTRIACDPSDIFPAINCIDRPVEKTMVHMWYDEVFGTVIPEVTERIELQNRNGVSLLYPDYNHTLPVWDTFFTKGFAGIPELVREAYTSLTSKKTLTGEEKAFFESIEITYEALLRFIKRLADLAKKTAGSEKLAEALGNLCCKAPDSFYEALLLDYLYFMVSEHLDAVQVRSCGHFDRLFYPFYKRDLERGIKEETLKSQLAHFFLQFVAIGNYWGQPVYLGGTDAEGNTEINPLSYVFLEVYDNLGILNPKVQIKYNAKTTPKDFTDKVLCMIRKGHNSLVFVSEEHMRRSLLHNGVPEEEIIHADVKGCYEFLIHGGSDNEDQQLNLLKPLEFALHGGYDALSGELVGLKCTVNYPSFEDLMTEYKRQLQFLIEESMKMVNAFEQYMSQINPQPLQTATFPYTLATAKDLNSGGGITNNTYMCLGAIGTVAVALTAIKKYVYDQKKFTLEELITILDNNFEGYEDIYRMLNNDPDKYGNNLELPDTLAVEVVSFACSCINGKPNAPIRGGWWGCSTHIARGIYNHGKHSAASADGRLVGEELSKNLTYTLGKNRNGVTAAVLSATKFDPMEVHLNPCLDAIFSLSSVKDEDGLDAMRSVLDTYFSLGGGAFQMNVANAEELKKAQKHPEQYKDLQIRVSGWSVRFNDINKEEQDGFIRQAENA